MATFLLNSDFKVPFKSTIFKVPSLLVRVTLALIYICIYYIYLHIYIFCIFVYVFAYLYILYILYIYSTKRSCSASPLAPCKPLIRRSSALRRLDVSSSESATKWHRPLATSEQSAKRDYLLVR